MSAKPCGCDPDIHYLCAHHLAFQAEQPYRYSCPAQLTHKTYLTNDPVHANPEIKTVDPHTGGAKGTKLARFDLLPPEAMWALAEHYGQGSTKYEDRNWEKGYKWGLCVAALQRHLYQWLGGESYDRETGSHHLIAVAWHAFALFTFERRQLGTDDVRRIV